MIDKGQIAEQGTHEELLAKNGVYKKLVLRQLMAGSDNGDLLQPQEGLLVNIGTELGSGRHSPAGTSIGGE